MAWRIKAKLGGGNASQSSPRRDDAVAKQVGDEQSRGRAERRRGVEEESTARA